MKKLELQNTKGIWLKSEEDCLIDIQTEINECVCCSICGNIQPNLDYWLAMEYCGSCGSKMR